MASLLTTNEYDSASSFQRPPTIGEDSQSSNFAARPNYLTQSQGIVEVQHEQSVHTLSRSRESSRAQSPSFIPRRMSKPGSMQDITIDGEPPLGYEPCGSAELSPPFSEDSTPPFMKWAMDLEYLMDDFDGCALFRQYLKQEGVEALLEFWFARKALQFASDYERIQGIVYATFRNYIRPHGNRSLGGVISAQTRIELTKRITKQLIDKNIFDEAFQEVEHDLRLRQNAFVQSDIYIQYVQAMQNPDPDSPRECAGSGQASHTSSSSSSNSGENQRLCPAYLPTVHEELTELDDGGMDRPNSVAEIVEETEKCGGRDSPRTIDTVVDRTRETATPPPGFRPLGERSPMSGNRSPAGFSGKRNKPLATRLTPSSLLSSHNKRAEYGHSSGKSGGLPPFPYHVPPKYTPWLPGSAQDSEAHSMSSDADSMFTDSGSEYFQHHRFSTKAQAHYQKRIVQKSALQNRELELAQTVIPRTQRELPRDAQPQKPAVFAALLTEKLEKYLRETKDQAKLQETLKKISDDGGTGSNNSRRAALLNFCRNPMNFSNDDDPAGVLDEHLSRVWEDSPKQSPHRSPGPDYGRKRSPGWKSPDRRGLGFPRAMVTSYPLPQSVQQFPQMAASASGANMMFGRFMGATVDHAPMFSAGVSPFCGVAPNKHRSSTGSSGHPLGLSPLVTAGNAGAGMPTFPFQMVKPLSSQQASHKQPPVNGCPDATSQQNTTSGHPSTSGSSNLPSSDRRGSCAQAAKTRPTPSRPGFAISDSSGIESGMSSVVSAPTSTKLTSQQKVNSWIACNAAANNNGNVSDCTLIDHASSKAKQRSTQASSNAYKNKESSSISNKPLKTSSNNNSSNQKCATTALSSNEVSSAPQTLPRRGGTGRKSDVSGSAPVQPLASPFSSFANDSNDYLSIGYTFPNEGVPFLTKWPGKQITLKQFKQLIGNKKGPFKYFFKCISDEMGTGVVFREVHDDYEVLPLWDGKVHSRLEPI